MLSDLFFMDVHPFFRIVECLPMRGGTLIVGKVVFVIILVFFCLTDAQ
jgi:hypothetical protein